MQKNNSSQLVTKGFLKSELEYKLGELEQRVDDRAKQYRDQILTKIDGVMGELETIREDNIIGTHQILNLQETAEITTKKELKA